MTQPTAPSETGSTEKMPAQKGMGVFRLFGIPAVITAIALALYLFFSWLVQERSSVETSLRKVLESEGSVRWQAAFDLATLVKEKKDLSPSEKELFIRALKVAKDPVLQQYLALTAGNLKMTESIDDLMNFLETGLSEEVVLSSMWSLAKLYPEFSENEKQRIRFLGLLESSGSSSDAGVRKMVAYTLGHLKLVEKEGLLVRLFDDPDFEVKINGAISLVRIKNFSGKEFLLQLLDVEPELAGFLSLAGETRELVQKSVLQVVASLPVGDVKEKVVLLSKESKNLRVRNEAFKVLKLLKKTVANPSSNL